MHPEYACLTPRIQREQNSVFEPVHSLLDAWFCKCPKVSFGLVQYRPLSVLVTWYVAQSCDRQRNRERDVHFCV